MARTFKHPDSKAVRTSVTMDPGQLAALQQEAAAATRREEQSVSAQLRAAIDMYLLRLTNRRARDMSADEGGKSDDNHNGR